LSVRSEANPYGCANETVLVIGFLNPENFRDNLSRRTSFEI